VPWNCDLSKDIYTCFFLSFDQGHNYIAQEMYRLGICRQLFLDTAEANKKEAFKSRNGVYHLNCEVLNLMKLMIFIICLSIDSNLGRFSRKSYADHMQKTSVLYPLE